MRYIYLLSILCLFSCNNERILHLPEIENAEVTEVLDVSPAYIFYDETQPDSTLLNRKNIISTTNWLVNVDKRLTLGQAIPKITMMQDKKRNAEIHKNEAAKNYYTCNDTTIKNLGFLEFTDVYYITDINVFGKDKALKSNDRLVLINFMSDKLVAISEFYERKQTKDEVLEIDAFLNEAAFEFYREHKNKVSLAFSKDLNFQDYITLKHKVLQFTNEMTEISTEELIY